MGLGKNAENAELWSLAAASFLGLGQFEEARKTYREVLRRDSKDLTALLGLARCEEGLHRIEEARGILESILAVHPDNTEAQTMLERLKS
jgi:tetratricopeptide (TPR) repeat protein